MRNLLLTLMYDGTNYHGWQVQENAVTVQETLQNAMEELFAFRPDVIGCSRTDSGVHANMFCCNFRVESDLREDNIVAALNAKLPGDIAVISCAEKDMEFHARYSCKGKEYIYKIWNSGQRNPFYENRYLHYKRFLDTDMLNEEAKAFLGTHDFKGFASSGSSTADTVRTISDIGFIRDGDEVIFRVTADGFLYNMVRIIVGTLIHVNEGKIEKGTVKDIIASGERERAGVTAKAHGLYLNRVIY